MTQQPMANPGREWAARWSRSIGEAIAHHRKEAGLTAAQLGGVSAVSAMRGTAKPQHSAGANGALWQVLSGEISPGHTVHK